MKFFNAKILLLVSLLCVAILCLLALHIVCVLYIVQNTCLGSNIFVVFIVLFNLQIADKALENERRSQCFTMNLRYSLAQCRNLWRYVSGTALPTAAVSDYGSLKPSKLEEFNATEVDKSKKH